jgi:hypothetical protein
MKIQDWFTPRRTVALALVLVGSALQIYAILDAGRSYLSGVGMGLLVVGLVIELLGQAISRDKHQR